MISLKEAHQRLYPQENIAIAARLLYSMQVDKIFKHADITITTLSLTLNFSERKISDAVKEVFNVDFNEFINYYRIQESLNF